MGYSKEDWRGEEGGSFIEYGEWWDIGMRLSVQKSLQIERRGFNGGPVRRIPHGMGRELVSVFPDKD